jgi:hypothetical protein
LLAEKSSTNYLRLAAVMSFSNLYFSISPAALTNIIAGTAAVLTPM